ncbi:MAG TPA: GH116 family glycosyl hydrolase [Ktedonobacteraceae bacterium]|nr:GH116 family glycosyl hydrolase [Ktedonobacteraceae bacterium]
MGLHSEQPATLRADGFVYQGEATRHVALPLGGLGTGQIALGGDGGLRQWQMMNQVNHLAFLPASFFALRVTSPEPPIEVVRILQGRAGLERPGGQTPLVNDDVIPAEQLQLLREIGGVEQTTFTGSYPFARLVYEDEQLPVEVQMEAFSPFVPLDAAASGLPAIYFTFTIRNRTPYFLQGSLGAALQNALGWDGITPINGNCCPLYGGNVNRVRQTPAYSALVMENVSLPDDHPGMGQMVLATTSPHARIYERWTDARQFVHFMADLNPSNHLPASMYYRQRGNKATPGVPAGPSPTGQTWNGGLLVPFWLHEGESTTVSFLISWHFPNRYVNFDQFGLPRDYGKSRFWLGNEYSGRFTDAVEVVEYCLAEREKLETTSRAWSAGIFQSTLPDWLREMLAAQGAQIRSPTTFRTEDGKLFGFEGALGASTYMWNSTIGGSCPLNCTHVWNYEMALSRLFPQLERSMRETDLQHVQAPEGYIPHRTVLPLYLPQFWNEPIFGPENPALDGMLGTVLKVYREVRQGGGLAWLAPLWPRVKRLVEYIIAHWDAERDGVLEGEQPNTYDIAFFGPNIYIGGLWLAALRAAEEMAKLQHEPAFADELRQLFQRGSARYDELLWNGEYYIQLLAPTQSLKDQFGQGCLADQLFGQWWAHLLELGYILPAEHVKTTLRSLVRYNFRSNFRDFKHQQRIFADQDDAGLVLCTWPHGGRPEHPMAYCDEVWTGIEYQVGAHCLMEGMLEEGMRIIAALRKRYNGTRRNPYNEIECGDHYARAMAGWSVLEAISGFHFNALDDALTFAPVTTGEEFRAPFLTAHGWGSYTQQTGHICSLACSYGEMRIRHLTLPAFAAAPLMVRQGEKIPRSTQEEVAGKILLSFEPPVILQAGDTLTITGKV